MAELTSYGFERETYPEILEKVKDRIREHLGVDANLNDDSPLGQWAAILAKTQNDNNRLAESVWSSQRLAGAEGIYLDDIFSKNGVYRRGKQAASGSVIVELDSTTALNQTIPTTSQFLSGSSVFTTEEEVLLTASVVAYTLDIADISDTNYDVVFVDTLGGSTNNLVFTNDGSDASKITMLEAMASSILSLTEGNEDRIFVDTDNGVLYIGYYISSSELVGLKEATEFQISPNVGTKFSSVSVVAQEAGYDPTPAGNIDTLTPTFTGLTSVTNLNALYPGSEIETDAEYRERYFTEISALSGSTRDGVVSNVLKVDGVTKVRLYDNPTRVNQSFADAFTFHVVVLGGTTADISDAIYKSKPINTATYGGVSYSIDTLDGDTEIIRHSKAIQVDVNFIVDYKTSNRVPLSNVEKTSIINGLNDFMSSHGIGETLYNTQLVFTCLNSVTRSRVVSVSVRARLADDATSEFSTLDLYPGYTDLFVLPSGGVSFNQLV